MKITKSENNLKINKKVIDNVHIMRYYLINTQLVGRRKIMNNKLVKLRGTRTQEEIANAIGISISAIGMYETGQRVPRDEIKVKLANFYNVSIESLFFDNNVHSEKTRTK